MNRNNFLAFDHEFGLDALDEPPRLGLLWIECGSVDHRLIHIGFRGQDWARPGSTWRLRDDSLEAYRVPCAAAQRRLRSARKW